LRIALRKSLMAEKKARRWPQEITGSINALGLEPGVFSWDDPRTIALSLKW
jgi:hypothetical protein